MNENFTYGFEKIAKGLGVLNELGKKTNTIAKSKSLLNPAFGANPKANKKRMKGMFENKGSY